MRGVSASFLIAITTAVLLTGVGDSHATQVRPLNLEEMTARAETIFSGRCIAVASIADPRTGGQETRATFEVHRAIKGIAGSTITVRLFGDSIIGLPSFSEGEDVVLFLYGESKLGLRSPVGFGQGKFSIVEGKQGRKIAVNEFGNRNLMRGMSASARTRLGPAHDLWKDTPELDYGALLDMAEQLAF